MEPLSFITYRLQLLSPLLIGRAFRGGSRILSRGGGGVDFQKEIENFDDLFFSLGRPN